MIHRPHLWRSAILPAVWVLLLVQMLRVRYRDPFGRSPTHPGYGENMPGDLTAHLLVSAIEVAVLLIVVRPWKDTPAWSRLLIALALFAPWSWLAMMIGMHAGSIDATHTFWRFGIAAGLALACLVSALQSLSQRAQLT